MLTLITLLSFLLPYQLSYHLNNFQNTVYGFKIDYLIPTIYLTDIVSFFIIIFGIKKLKFNKRYYLYFALYLVFVCINMSSSLNIISSLYKWIKVTEMILVGVIIFNTNKFDLYKHFLKPLSYSIFTACILGILQFLHKGSIGGFFYFLGERQFVFGNPNIANFPYSTFSHPNSLAGFLMVYGILLLQFAEKFNRKWLWTLLVLIFVNIILTNSLNIYLTIVFLLVLKSIKENIANVIVLDFSQRFITHRIELIIASWQMIKTNFWFGVGLNNFIPNLVKVSNTFINAWELQPVHNIFLLIFSETGIFGLLALSCIVLSGLTLTSYSLIAILFSGLSDHYWLTLQQNMLLFVYVLIINIKWKKKN